MLGWGTILGALPAAEGEGDEYNLQGLNNTACALSVYPFEDLPPNTTLCDVGGGIGVMSRAILSRHPHLSITLQDLDKVVQEAREVCLLELTVSQLLFRL
jgi:hypothetical protein